MRVSTKFGPSYTVACCVLEHREAVLVERGAMCWMSDGLKVSADLGGGVVKAAFRHSLGKESFVWARYTADIEGAWVVVSPRFPGDVVVVTVDESTPLRSQTGALLAVSANLEMSVKTSSVSNVLMREGAMVMETAGNGEVVVGSYGAIETFDLQPGQPLYVDSGHLVAWHSTVRVKASTLQGAANSVLSGEGVIAEVTGPGTVWLQTRAEEQLRSWLLPDREQRR